MSDTPDHDPEPTDVASDHPSMEGADSYSNRPQPLPLTDLAGDGDELILSEDRRNPLARKSVSSSPTMQNTAASETQEQVEAAPITKVRPRRVRLPLILFIITCVSTFWVGVNHWLPIPTDDGVRQTLLAHWQEGLTYMGCVLGILLAHEMGHFLATVRYGISASFPYFIPFPISPIGTMGAVIGMDGLKADRKELFDIGLAGPLAGLLIAIPIMWIGVAKLDFNQVEYGPFALDLPLLTRMALHQLQPPGYTSQHVVWFSHLNAYFMAGWVGCLITGLNMMPVSQLDGGHVMYTLFGRKAHWIARAFVVMAILLVAIYGHWSWSPMILLVLFIGPDHPPTRDDSVPLGRVRTILGFAAVLIPVFCFPIRLIIVPA